ncbi:MAG: hypothetical protein GC201_10105 [Alphaproteobacteria bacterium]|nr:hypothetical protein [Alphaproteobacteria bacterium]
MIRSSTALAAALGVLATWSQAAAETSCDGNGTWRAVSGPDVVMSASAAATTSGWTLVEGNGKKLQNITDKMTQVLKKDVRFNGTDNGQRNELTVYFLRPGVAGGILSYTMTVEGRKRRPQGVLVREIKVKGFKATGVSCTRDIDPNKKFVKYEFILGE